MRSDVASAHSRVILVMIPRTRRPKSWIGQRCTYGAAIPEALDQVVTLPVAWAGETIHVLREGDGVGALALDLAGVITI